VHALTVLLITVFFSRYVSYVPMAGLAALLLYVAYHMADVKLFARILRFGTGEDKIVLLACFFLTVCIDMTVGVSAGVMLAALLFIHRIAAFSGGNFMPQQLISHADDETIRLPSGIEFYRIAGPMFFGAAEKAVSSMTEISIDSRVMIIDLSLVPMIDMTGIVALESAIETLQQKNCFCILASGSDQVLKQLRKIAFFTPRYPYLAMTHDLKSAKVLASLHLRQISSGSGVDTVAGKL
jgi:SulP family sulfate permease